MLFQCFLVVFFSRKVCDKSPNLHSTNITTCDLEDLAGNSRVLIYLMILSLLSTLSDIRLLVISASCIVLVILYGRLILQFSIVIKCNDDTKVDLERNLIILVRVD